MTIKVGDKVWLKGTYTIILDPHTPNPVVFSPITPPKRLKDEFVVEDLCKGYALISKVRHPDHPSWWVTIDSVEKIKDKQDE